jgi:hypothetical protein
MSEALLRIETMLIHTRTVADRVFEVWRSPGRFTKNPDLIQLPSGRLMLIYSDTDSHWSQEKQILTLLASDDMGKTWFKHKEVASADLRTGEERLVTPRLSILRNGRLVVLCDHDDDGHFHEEQTSGNWAWWSNDSGDTWSERQVTGILGFEPDRMMDLPDGRLAVCSHLMRGETQEFAVIISCSDDGGRTWYEQATVAHDGYHRFCEGALVVMDGGKELACVMRENHSAGIPSFVAFSQDMGRTWSEPQMLPFAIHRPYAKQLPDGRVLVTGRHVNGGLGTYAWCGDLHEEAGTYQIGGPRCNYTAELTDEALVIDNRSEHECRYTLLPPESSRTEVVFEAEVKVDGPKDKAAAFMSISKLTGGRGPLILYIAPNRVTLMRESIEFSKPMDMTRYRRIRIHHRRGLCQVHMDGQLLFRTRVYREEASISDFHGGNIARRTQFGQLGDEGQSFWKGTHYTLKNPTLDEFEWTWEAAKGERPDEYQRQRMIQIHANHPDQKPNPDHGYSSWIMLEDGRIFLVDYTNYGDEPGESHLVGVYLDPEDIA